MASVSGRRQGCLQRFGMVFAGRCLKPCRLAACVMHWHCQLLHLVPPLKPVVHLASGAVCPEPTSSCFCFRTACWLPPFPALVWQREYRNRAATERQDQKVVLSIVGWRDKWQAEPGAFGFIAYVAASPFHVVAFSETSVRTYNGRLSNPHSFSPSSAKPIHCHSKRVAALVYCTVPWA